MEAAHGQGLQLGHDCPVCLSAAVPWVTGGAWRSRTCALAGATAMQSCLQSDSILQPGSVWMLSLGKGWFNEGFLDRILLTRQGLEAREAHTGAVSSDGVPVIFISVSGWWDIV